MTGSTFDGEIWTLNNIDTINNLKWQKLSKIPNKNIDTLKDFSILVKKDSKQVFVFAADTGVFSLQL